MKRLPIHVRLTAWYLLSLAVIITLFAVGSWYAMRASMFHSIDRDLNYRMRAVIPFIESHSLETSDDFRKTFQNLSDSSVVGVFVQITGANSNVLYQSNILASHRVAVFPPGPADGSVVSATFNNSGWPVRVASRRIFVEGHELNVHIVEPLRDLLGGLQETALSFTLLVFLALVLTAITGYWISRRALAPVEQIRRQADAIDLADLTARLEVPRTDDELARLARTLNSMLARIEAGFRSVQQFTADASHELRSPLAFIITAGDVSLRRPRTNEELTSTLSSITAEARRMTTLVEDLLALARSDAQQAGTSKEHVDLTAMLRELADQFAPTAHEKRLHLSVSLPEQSIPVPGTASNLRRLFVILLDNAIKYTDHGEIHLSLITDDANACVTMRDTGIGIDSAALPYIFDRFWRADKVRSRAEGGAGLGLSLARQIVQNHHGKILVQSFPGQGSSFFITLPIFKK